MSYMGYGMDAVNGKRRYDRGFVCYNWRLATRRC
jgi:hypothetical protein